MTTESEKQNSRGGFSTKLGLVLAAAGSAIGLGNIWRFPTETGEYGGSAFLLVYLVCIVVFGLPLMIAEFAVGRGARSSTGNAYSILAPKTNWKYIGLASTLTAFLILGYYNVVAGWTLFYLGEAAAGSFVSGRRQCLCRKLRRVRVKSVEAYRLPGALHGLYPCGNNRWRQERH